MGMSPTLLRPRQNLHPDAASWASRVVANGGSVGSSLPAVNTFCKAIAAAGIRDRFYRLNLFCGASDASLNAVRTPLYRGPSLSGTQFGNTTDTNNLFVAGDYAETGTTGGLKGNGSTKYLETGLAMTFLGTNQLHLFSSFLPDASSVAQQVLSSRANLAGSVSMEHVYNGTNLNRHRVAVFSSGAQPAGNGSPITGRTQLMSQISSGTTVNNHVRNVDVGDTAGGSYSAANTTQFYVFAGEQTGTGMIGHAFVRMDAYSIGAAFASAAQRTAFHDAMAAFRTALGRT